MNAPSRRSIQILPENVVHKIAAGEVVERPVSVVKELVENSLDAGATRIRVHVEGGGLARIQVCDDGAGIPPHELPLALKRHATSKLTAAEDLFSLRTLGFRGEALPSIASVSDFRLESATADTTPVGYALDVRSGKLGELSEAAMEPGTRVSVDRLFCTTPARLKFMKRPETEWGHIHDLLTALALSHCGIEWELTNQGKRSLFCPPARDAKHRVLDLFGRDVADNLFPVDREVSGMRLTAWIGHPNFSKRSNRNLFVFVNGRYVQDRLIQHAILTGYRGLLMTGQYPMVILYLEMDPALVDVNVHPTKRELRFASSNTIHHLISETIRDALERSPWRGQARDVFAAATAGGGNGGALSDGPARSEVGFQQSGDNLFSYAAARAERETEGEVFSAPAHRAKIGTLAFAELQLIGQFNQTYLVCAQGEALILIDQHAAHERIGYERLKAGLRDGPMPRQGLLHPLTFDLAETDAANLRRRLVELETFGFLVEEFGESTFVLKAHPALLPEGDWVGLLKELAAELEEEGGLKSVEDKIDHVLATMACHRQIRAGDSLKREEMMALLGQLEGTPRSYHCPHGRPVMVEIESREIERWFKRIL